MTDTVETAETVKVVEEVTEPVAPPGHYYSLIKGRRILIKDINEAQSMILGGYLRQINGVVNFDLVMEIFGKLCKLLDNLVATREDMAWLEDQILEGNIEIADFAAVFHSHTRETKPVAAKKPRRGK